MAPDGSRARAGGVADNGGVPALDPAEQRARLAAAPVARLATLRPEGAPRLVPITFVLVDEVICSAVDDVKPKRSTRLARLADVERDPRVGLLVDHYAADWSTLWWVRVDGVAGIRTGGALYDRAVAALVRKYPPYATTPPTGPVLVIEPTRWTGWSAAPAE
jgi:PPOX class probable F420-dependent enzyme